MFNIFIYIQANIVQVGTVSVKTGAKKAAQVRAGFCRPSGGCEHTCLDMCERQLPASAFAPPSTRQNNLT